LAVTKRWLALFLIGVLPIMLSGFGSLFGSVMEAAAAAWYAMLIALVIADRKVTPAPSEISVVREIGDRFSLGVETAVSLRVRNGSDKRVRVMLRDSRPPSMPLSIGLIDPDEPVELTMEARSGRIATYSVTPKQRGKHEFGDIYMTVRGRLGMVERIRRIDAAASVKVYPSLAHTSQFELMARRGKLQQLGVRKTRLQGAGRDFESLREYLPDDELRRIDWKATARRGKLVSRQYEVEQSQAIIIVLDVGRTMLTEIDGVQKLDYAIDAALLLAYVATLSDDMVGLLVFSDQVHSFLPPRRGKIQVHAILEHLYDARASMAEADYQAAFAYLQTRWRKRALIVCFTDLWDPDSARQTIMELGSLQPRHLVCAVTVLDLAVVREAEQAVTTAESVYRKAVAIQVMDEREKAHAALAQRGVLVVDSPADSISIALVNRYLQVKERMML